MKIAFVSDVACPWCAIGLNALERALRNLPDLPVELHFEPFELNPRMPPEGEDAAEHLMHKYGLTHEQLQRNREALRARGAAVGFTFGARSRIWNTFDAHRLLAWALAEASPALQRALKHALLAAYHTHDRNPGAPEVLLAAVEECGGDVARAREVLDGGEYADAVRERERHWQSLGISAVPSVIVDDRHLIQGGQPPEVFEQALRQIAAGG